MMLTGYSEAIREAVQATVRATVYPPADQGALNESLHTLCTLAHNEGLRVEQVLILLRAEWDRTPSVWRSEFQTLRARMVTVCIQHFFELGGPERSVIERQRT